MKAKNVMKAKKDFGMEEVIARFPHLAEQILNSLHNKSLADCREVSQTWQEFISNERFYKNRIKDERHFQSLCRLLPPHARGKLTKTNILQQIAEYLNQLEQKEIAIIIDLWIKITGCPASSNKKYANIII